MSNTKQPTNMIIVGDFGKDQDDELTLVLTKLFVSLGYIKLLAVVANLSPSIKRAMLAKGTLQQLGLPDVPVGIGTNAGVAASGSSNHEFADIPYLAPASALVNGQDLLRATLSNANDKDVTLVLISGLTDAAQLLKSSETLVAQKVERVVIMGGVIAEGDSAVRDADGFLQPDTAANNNFDPSAAQFLYKRLQELGIPMTILTRNAAYACKIPRATYDRLAGTKHVVGTKIRDKQKQFLNRMWKLANLESEDPQRERLPARCNRQWFLNTFCDGKPTDRSGDEQIWDMVINCCLYDPLTLIAATKCTNSCFSPEIISVNGTEHSIIGVSPTKHGLINSEKLSEQLISRLKTALIMARPLGQSACISWSQCKY